MEKQTVAPVKDSIVATSVASFEEAEDGETLPSNAVTVTIDRKSKLLLEARADRIAWVQAVPLPYSKTDGMKQPSVFHSTHSLQQVPSASRVISALYGEGDGITSDEIGERIESLLEEMGQNTPEHHALVVPTARQILEKELAHSKGTHEVLLRAYRRFLSKLQMPESATLVQGMRGFVRSLRDSSQASVAKSLQSYFDSTMAMLKSHPAFSSEPDFDMVQRSLQSFVYGHGKDSVWLTIDTKQDEVNFKRWQALQFVTPEHLDIPCLIGKSPADLDFLLKDSISALNLLELFFSPYEKLQCILKAYHGINAALSVALNRKAGSKKLPSADDILPTLILSVLRAKPKAVVSNLAMIETFSPPEHLRGEAGYAYTNLYGAIQFLLDLDLDKDPEKLTISSQDFRNGLDTCRAAAESKFSRREIQADREMQPLAQLEDLTIPASVIRSARLAGVTTNVHWAKQWYEENGRVTTITGELSGPEVLPDILPSGFTRSYSFLTTRPDEVRVSDLPHLLAEYRMLVHTTEVLLAERSSRQSVERKRRFASEQKRLEEEALELELHLELKTNK